MSVVRGLASLGALLWVSYAVTLWPLPSRLAADVVASFKAHLSEAPPWTQADWDSRSEWERKETKRVWAEAEQGMRRYVDEAAEFEAVLWVKWALRLALLLLGIVGWMLFLRRVRFWKVLVLGTTLVLVVGQSLFHWIVYADLFREWAAGSTGFTSLPWSFTITTLYLYFALPILLIALTGLAYSRQTHEARV